MTIREFTSTIQESLNASNPDDFISEEYIFNVGVSVAQLLIKREIDSRKLFKMTSLFKTECIKLVESTGGCGGFSGCTHVMRSKHKLPKSYLTNFGNLLIVLNVTGETEYKEISPSRYRNLKLQKFKPRDTKYFWIDDDYLEIPDSNVQEVKIMYLGPGAAEDSECSVLDNTFPAPEYMMSTILSETLNHVFSRKKINPDENPNLNNNEK